MPGSQRPATSDSWAVDPHLDERLSESTEGARGRGGLRALGDGGVLGYWREIAARAKARNAEERAERDRARLRWLSTHAGGCWDCQDTGLRYGALNTPCDCGAGRAILSRRRADAFATLWSAAHIPPRARTFSLDTFPSPQIGAYAKAREFLGRWDSDGGTSGLVLTGDYSKGKTGLMIALARAIAEDLFATTPYRIRFMPSVELMQALRPTDGRSGDAERESLFRDLLRVRLLLLDDIGKDKPTDWVHDRLFTLINHRTSHLLPTFVTTNYALDDLAPRVGEGVVDRLVEACEVIEMDADAPNLRTRH
jgi:DNA replication protein DnaC